MKLNKIYLMIHYYVIKNITIELNNINVIFFQMNILIHMNLILKIILKNTLKI
jgi:hypothetical protein